MQIYTIYTLLFYCLLFASCQNSAPAPLPATEEEENEEPDSLEARWKVRDTIELEQGDMPEDWHKQDLGKGFYIAFPEKPKRSETKAERKIQYKLEKSKYTLLLTQTDLTGQEELTRYRQRPEAFFESLFEDMSKELDAAIAYQYSFLILDTYVAARAHFQSEEEQFTVQAVLAGNTLFTASSIIWKKESAALFQIRDYFFASFGKELHLE